MNDVQFFTILGSLITILGTTIGAIMWLHRDLKGDIIAIGERLEKQSERTDKLYEIFCEESRKHTERTDKLYEMFQEGLCKQTERTDQLYNMFIELVKSKK